MMTIKFCLVVVLAGVLASAHSAAAAQPVTDPIGEMVRLGKVNKEGEVLSATFDWNEDGKPDFLVTTSADVAIGGQYTEWAVWLSNPAGAFDMVGSVTLTPGIVSIARLAESGNSKAVVASFHAGGGLLSLTAYYLTPDRKIEAKEIGMIGEQAESRTPEYDALERRVFGSAEKVETISKPAADLWPEEGPVTAPPVPLPKASESDTIEVLDPLDKTRWLILRASSFELVGYRLGDRPVSLEEAKKLGLPLTRDVRAERAELALRQEHDLKVRAHTRQWLTVSAVVVILGAVAIFFLRRRKASKGNT